MVKPDMQQLKVKIEFSYEAELFDGDPTDAYEIARLETLALENDLQAAIDTVLGDVKFFRVSIQPD